jgi:formylmethanofuran dehydrogenase subunit B
VAIDTGVAGIHEGGIAYRMDEVPLPLRPPLTTRRSAADTLRALTASLQSRLQGNQP